MFPLVKIPTTLSLTEAETLVNQIFKDSAKYDMSLEMTKKRLAFLVFDSFRKGTEQ